MKKVSIIIPVYNQQDLIINALDSIPRRDYIEVIVVDDGSNDNTWDNITNYDKANELDLIVLSNGVNQGVGYSRNKGIEMATGEYILFLDSDDYLYTDKWDEFIEYLNGTDLVYYNIQVNNGDIWYTTNETKESFCGTTKAVRRKFIGDTTFPNIQFGEDWYFYQDLLKKNPTEKFTNITLIHYNFPRNGSLCNIANSEGEDS